MTRSKAYKPELREEAVKLVLTQGLTIGDAALRLTIPRRTLANWVTAAKHGTSPKVAPKGRPVAEFEPEITTLRKELAESRTAHPTTPDGRYFVVTGRLWRTSNPALEPDLRQTYVDQLMTARRQVGAAVKAGDGVAEHSARALVDAAKRALGERGPVWWDDGAPDYNRRMVGNTPYAQWYATLAPDVEAT